MSALIHLLKIASIHLKHTQNNVKSLFEKSSTWAPGVCLVSNSVSKQFSDDPQLIILASAERIIYFSTKSGSIFSFFLTTELMTLVDFGSPPSEQD